MKRGGHAMLLLILVLVAASVGAGAFVTRLSINLNARTALALRHQALWLARSACSTNLSGPRTVQVQAGPAVVARTGIAVKVQLARGTATIDCVTHQERYTAPTRD